MERFHNLSIISKVLIPPIAAAASLAMITLLSISAGGRLVSTRLSAHALGLTLAATFVAALISTRLVAQSIRRITRAMDDLADGHLSAEIRGLERKDEIGAMSRALEQFRANALERERLEEALRLQTAQLEALRQVSLEMSAELDLDALLHLVNRQAVELVGGDGGLVGLYRPEQELVEFISLYGVSSDQIVPAVRRSQGITGLVFATGQAQIKNEYHRWEGNIAQGDQSPAAAVAVPIQRGDEFLGVLTVVAYGRQRFSSANTELLNLLASQAAVAIDNARLHQRVQQYAEELELRVYERTQELSAANERLKGLDRLKSQFISDVSHELRTPLTNLVLYLDLLERSDPEKHPRYMAVIRSKSDQLVHFTEDILRISRLSLYEDETDFSRADLNEIVRHVVDASRGPADAKGLALFFQPAADLPPILAETNLLAQACASVLDNAIAYTDEGEITVSTDVDEGRDQIMLQITDTGMGISDDDLPHIFDRFYRGRRVGQLDKPGTGLGLAVFKETVDLHGGQVEVASHEGLGTVFRAWLPLPRQLEA